MSGSEDWRFRKAQELGLVDTRPLAIPKGRSAQPAAPRQQSPPQTPPPHEPPPAPPQHLTPATVAPPRRPATTPAPGTASKSQIASPALLAVICIAVVVAAAGGWLLRGTIGQPDPVMTLAAASLARPTEAEALPLAAPSPPKSTAMPAQAPPDIPPESQPLSQPVLPPAARPVTAAPTIAPPQVTAQEAKLPAAIPVGARPAAKSAAKPTAKAIAKPAVPIASGVRPARQGAPRPSAKASAHRIATPSFDCRRAGSEVNRMICADFRLGTLDRAVSDAYRAAVRRGGTEADYNLDRDQASFLNARAGCTTPGCVARITKRRLDDLAY